LPAPGATPALPGLSFDTVLVPVDGSDESARAVEYAVAIADRYDAAVHVIEDHVDEVVEAVLAARDE
jgi:nucleotide-binding universal stress UspA family protein